MIRRPELLPVFHEPKLLAEYLEARISMKGAHIGVRLRECQASNF